MIDRTLTTYTVLNYLAEKGLSQIDLYVPLACKSILTHSANTIDARNLANWFDEDYGLSKVYKGVFVNLLKRMSSLGIVSWDKNMSVVNTNKVIERIEESDNKPFEQTIEELCNRVSNFAKEFHSQEYTNDDIQKGLLNFFHNHDGDLLLEEKKLFNSLQKQNIGRTVHTKIKYIISQFVIWSKKNDSPSFGMMKNLSKGHAVTSIISMKDVANYVGKMKDVIIALDTPIIFNLLELNNESNYEIAKELMSILKKQNCKFIIFNQHYQEIKKTFSSTIHLLHTKDYILSKSSRLLKYAVRNNISASKLRAKMHQIDGLFEKWNIEINTAPDYPQKYSEIDLNQLEELMVRRYNDTGKELDENLQKTLANDIDAVSYIYRIRGNNIATNLKNCQAILLTTNTALAFASRARGISSIEHDIPVCMTDVLLSTVLWFNYPEGSDNVNEHVLLSECYKNITLSDEVLQRFYNEVKEINKTTPLTEEQMLEANTSNMVQELLEKKTYNDLSLYTDTTTLEILEQIEAEKNGKINKLKKQINTHEEKIIKISKFAAKITVGVLWLIVIAFLVWSNFLDLKTWKGFWYIFINAVTLIFSLWGLLCWFGCIPSKANLIDWLTSFIQKWITNWFNK